MLPSATCAPENPGVLAVPRSDSDMTIKWLGSACLVAVLLGGCGGTIGIGGQVDLAVPAPFDASGGGTDGPPCQGTAKSCGPSGSCADCTDNLFGSACVQGACGCNSPV